MRKFFLIESILKTNINNYSLLFYKPIMKKVLSMFFAFSLVAILAWCNTNTWIEKNQEPSEEVADTVKFEELWTMPSFEVETLDGQIVTDQTLLDSWKPTLVYFTASWCPTCAKNRPSLNAVYPDFKDQVNIISISIDATDTKEVIQKLADDKWLTYPMTAGYPQIMVDFGVTSQATTVAIDKDWNIIYMANKKHLTEEEYRSLLSALISQ
jgi:peroxiredoxin